MLLHHNQTTYASITSYSKPISQTQYEFHLLT
nr:MAG TPA_asm: hypothetical protein [Bacteriophage sp.]